jgi:16S rRNA (adenine1518-N6/adenine1519-N6)-dimethyltransferase
VKGGLGRAEVHRLLEEHGLAPKRSLGQNFVVDPNTVERIARLARVGPGDRVIEIGAGLGSLTLALIATGATVTAVELDAGLAVVLGEVVGDRARIVVGDASELDWPALLVDDGRRPGYVLVANLPYNVATSLVLGLLEEVPEIVRMLVMVQREVGERLAAPAGSRIYGAVSVRVAYFAEARGVGTVSPEVFHPRPRVTSELVEIVRRAAPAVDPDEVSYRAIDALVRAGFAQRRKMLRRSLAGLVDERAFEAAEIAPTARAEELDVIAWGKLARCQKLFENSPTPS